MQSWYVDKQACGSKALQNYLRNRHYDENLEGVSHAIPTAAIRASNRRQP